MDVSADDEGVEIVLREPEHVITRATILGALAYRGFLELDEQEADSEADGERFDLLTWLRDENLIDHVDPTELVMFQAPVGTLDEDSALAATWSTEALAPLCWALGLIPDLQPSHQPVDAATLLDLMPSSGSSTSEFIQQAALRDEDEIASAREKAELWYWRATMQDLLNTAPAADRNDLVTAILETAEEGADQGILPPPARGDFPVLGQPYAVAADHETLATIAEWRLRGLNWLCGFGTSWETTPLDL